MRRPPPPLDRTPASRTPPGLTRWLDDALREDRAAEDRTSQALPVRGRTAIGTVVVQADAVLSGVAVAAALARRYRLRAKVLRHDGEAVRSGRRILEVRGGAQRILAVERTLLNLLMHLSGVATETAKAVKAARSRQGGPEVYATRKTLPGWRDLEKQAVVDGGGHPHRRDLSSAVLLKSNHLALVPLPTAVARARRREGPGGLVQVEVGRLDDARRAIGAGANALLIDNLSPARARRLIHGLQTEGLRKKVWIELSGGITSANARRFSWAGADAISLGSLTHSAPSVPFHLMLRPLPLHTP